MDISPEAMDLSLFSTATDNASLILGPPIETVSSVTVPKAGEGTGEGAIISLLLPLSSETSPRIWLGNRRLIEVPGLLHVLGITRVVNCAAAQVPASSEPGVETQYAVCVQCTL